MQARLGVAASGLTGAGDRIIRRLAPMLAVAVLSRTALQRWRRRMLSAGHFGKVAIGLSAVAVGAMILTGAVRAVETALVSASPAWLTDLTTQF